VTKITQGRFNRQLRVYCPRKRCLYVALFPRYSDKTIGKHYYAKHS